MTNHWSTLQLTEYLAVISASDDEDKVLQLAVERATEVLEAEVAAVVIGTVVRATCGLGVDSTAAEGLRTIGRARSVRLPGLDPMHTFAARLGRNTTDFLVVGRLDEPLAGAERQTVQAMAQLLGLVLRNVRALGAERTLREQQQVLLREKEREAAERLRLLEVLRSRQRLLEQLLGIQQAVAARRPLPEVLDAVTAGAAELLGGCPVALVLDEPSMGQGLTVVSGIDVPTDLSTSGAVLHAAREAINGGYHASTASTGTDRLIAACVSVGRQTAGSLVAALDGHADAKQIDEQRKLLVAFAQQASLALTDAHTVRAVTEARHDPVTGLPNRSLFLDRLRDVLTERRNDILLFLDDRFQGISGRTRSGIA